MFKNDLNTIISGVLSTGMLYTANQIFYFNGMYYKILHYIFLIFIILFVLFYN